MIQRIYFQNLIPKQDLTIMEQEKSPWFHHLYIDNLEKHILEPVCCKKRQKNPYQENGLGNMGHQKVLNDTKLVLNEHDRSP